jgi:Large polyvalent protein-associated domain 3
MDNLEKLRQEIKTWAKDNLVGKKVYREELKDFIEFTWQGLKHDIGNNRKMQNERLELLKKMEILLQNADYQGNENDYHQRPDIKAYHYFSQQLENLPLLRIVIREMADKKVFYDHLFEIKDDQ